MIDKIKQEEVGGSGSPHQGRMRAQVFRQRYSFCDRIGEGYTVVVQADLSNNK